MVELKEVLDAMDFSKEDFTLEDITNHIKETFVARKMVGEDPEIVSAITGKAMGSITTALKRATKEAGIEVDFNAEDYKGKKIEDIISNVFAKNVLGEISALKEKAKSGNSKKDEEWEKQIQSLSTKVQEYEGLKTNLEKELENERQQREAVITGFKVNTMYNEAKSKVAFSDGVSPLTMTGFESLIKEKYAFGLDGDEVVIKDIKTGTRVKNDKGTDFLSIADVLTQEANAAGILKKNNAAPQNRNQFTAEPPANNGNPANPKQGFIHPNAQKTLEQLKSA